jgi:hypothetical protein
MARLKMTAGAVHDQSLKSGKVFSVQYRDALSMQICLEVVRILRMQEIRIDQIRSQADCFYQRCL